MLEESRKLAELAPKIMNSFHDLGRLRPDNVKLSMRQYQALIILNANETLTLSQLCEKLSLARSTGTELIYRMIKLQFIEKEQQDKDMRQIKLSIAPNGIELLNKRQQALSEMFNDYLKSFQPDDRVTFVECFSKIWQIIDKYQSKTK